MGVAPPFGCTTQGHCVGRRGREACAARRVEDLEWGPVLARPRWTSGSAWCVVLWGKGQGEEMHSSNETAVNGGCGRSVVEVREQRGGSTCRFRNSGLVLSGHGRGEISMMRRTAWWPVEIPAWSMGLCGYLGDLHCWMPRGAGIGGKGVGSAVIGRRAFPIV